VQGASYGRGPEVDVWYPNGGINQVFSMSGGSGWQIPQPQQVNQRQYPE